jgi:hypothetical protein
MALISLACLAVGCAGSVKFLPEYKLPLGCGENWTQEAFSDIDLPQGYTVLPDESFTYICPWWESVRIGRLVLLGDTRRDTMVRFYTASLESTGWTKVKEISSEYVDSTTLEFRKPERDEVIILKVIRTPANKIKIDLLLKPE